MAEAEEEEVHRGSCNSNHSSHHSNRNSKPSQDSKWVAVSSRMLAHLDPAPEDAEEDVGCDPADRVTMMILATLAASRETM